MIYVLHNWAKDKKYPLFQAIFSHWILHKRPVVTFVGEANLNELSIFRYFGGAKYP